jgi:hypothetical protein
MKPILLSASVREIAASELPSAFQEMAHDRACSQRVPIVGFPAECVYHGCQKQRDVGSPSGHDDVGIRLQCFHQRRDSEVRVGRNESVPVAGQWFTSVERSASVKVDAPGNLVACDDCDAAPMQP